MTHAHAAAVKNIKNAVWQNHKKTAGVTLVVTLLLTSDYGRRGNHYSCPSFLTNFLDDYNKKRGQRKGETCSARWGEKRRSLVL